MLALSFAPYAIAGPHAEKETAAIIALRIFIFGPFNWEMTLQPIQLACASRCGANTRLCQPCRSPAVSGRLRCRMHGGTNPGAPSGNRNARKHGGYSAEAKATAQFLKEIARLVDQVGG